MFKSLPLTMIRETHIGGGYIRQEVAVITISFGVPWFVSYFCQSDMHHLSFFNACKKMLRTYCFWLCCVFMAAHRLSRVAVRAGRYFIFHRLLFVLASLVAQCGL